MAAEAGVKEPHLGEAEYCPRMVTKGDTNLKLLMAEFNRLSQLDPDDPILQSPFQYFFTAYTSVDIKSDPRVTLKDLTEVPNEFHKGRFFVCRTKTASIWIHSLLAVVETPDSSKEYEATILSLGNYIYPVDKNYHSGNSFLSPGTIVVVKNPFYTRSKTDSMYNVKCDNPGDVVILEQEIFSVLFPNLKWPSSEPRSGENSLVIQQPWWWWWWGSKPTKDWKRIAELRLETKNYRGALEAYEFALDSSPKDIEIMTLRSALYLKLKVYEKSLKDSEVILEMEEKNEAAIYCKGLSLIGLGRYKLVIHFVETHIEKFRSSLDLEHEAELLKILSMAYDYRKEECGDYNILKIVKCSKTHSHHCADYVGNVRVQNIPGKGRGMVATADIQCGELLIAEKAFAIEYSKDMRFKTSAVHTSVKKELRRSIYVNLLYSIANRLIFNPDLGKELYKLYDGTPRDDVEENNFVDMQRICEICDYNSFGSSTHGMGESYQGLWIFASYVNHSCYDANTITTEYGDLMLIRACTNIQKNEEILISYIESYITYPERLLAISNYTFVCKCSLCELDSKDTDAIHTLRKQLLDEINQIKPESSTCSTVERLIMQLTSLRPIDSRRNVYIQKPIMKVAHFLKKKGDYERAGNLYRQVFLLSTNTVMFETSFESCYSAMGCLMLMDRQEEAKFFVAAMRSSLVRQFGTASKEIINFVSTELGMLMELDEIDP